MRYLLVGLFLLIVVGALSGCQGVDTQAVLPLCVENCTVTIDNSGVAMDRGGNSPTTSPNVDLAPL